MRKGLIMFALLAAFAMLAPHFADAASLSKAPNNLGLVGYWSFDDATSTKASDLSGRGTTGTLTSFALSGATSNWVAGKRGRALHFDGVNDYVDLGSKVLGYGNLTVSAWIKVGGGACSSQYVGIVSKNYYSDFVFAYTCSGADTGKVVAYVTNTSLTGSGNLFSNVLVNDGNWHHVTITSNGTNVRMYVDGAYQNQAALSGSVRDSASAISIGSYTGGLQFFGGSIDDVRIYSRALSDAEMAAMYRSGSVKYRIPSNTGLVGYWRFDDATSTKAGDSSGKGNTGTLVGPMSWVPGKLGGAIYSTGASGRYVNVTNNAGLSPSTRMTVAMWAKEDAISAVNSPGLIAKWKYNTQESWAMRVRPNGTIRVNIAPTLTDLYTVYGETPAGSWIAGRWRHVAFVYDGSQTGNANRLKIYIDGVQQSLSFGGTVPATLLNANSDITIGAEYSTAGFGFDGSIDQVMIYDRALGNSEIASMYRSGQIALNASQNDKLTSGLIGLWSFNGQDTTDTTAYDRSGQGKNGTLVNGPTPAIGKLGQGLSFDGSNDQVTISDTFDPTAYTISAWVKFTSTAAQNIFTRTDNTGPTSSWSHQLRLDSAGKFQHYAYDGGAKTVTGSTAIQPNTWYHVVGTAVDGGNMELFVNGVSQGTTPVTTLWIGGDRYVIGSSSGSAGEARGFLGGSVDDVRLYNRVLTTAEIRQLYNMGR